MRESTWLTSTHPSRMLNELKVRRPPDSGRKCRLFAASCCRRIWDLLVDRRSRRAVEALERFAEGALPMEDMAAFAREAQNVPWDIPEISATHHAAEAAAHAVDWDMYGRGSHWKVEFDSPNDLLKIFSRFAGAAYHSAHARGRSLHPSGPEARWLDAIRAEEVAQADLVREIFGNVCRPVEFPDSWRSTRAEELARAIEASLDFDGLPALGDALEEAGCDSLELMDHFRTPTRHVKGCWALDLVLGSRH